MQIGDGTGLTISHVGSTKLPTSTATFSLNNILCVPDARHNLISVSKFCKTNNVYFEFHPFFFCVKDRATGATLMHGPSSGDLYSLRPRAIHSPTSYSAIRLSPLVWHARIGHPSFKVLRQVLQQTGISTTSIRSSHCTSCRLNKSHKLSFHASSITTTSPLELIFSDVWGPSTITSINSYRYYVIFVDHFTRYVWLYPLKNKSEVTLIFPQFLAKLEQMFSHKIKSIYTDGGTKYMKLKPLFNSHEISHYISHPYTLEHIGLAERRHRHIVETAVTLLSHSSVPSRFWCFAFQTAVFLINRMPIATLHRQSPFELLFRRSPNYSSLKVFGCLCYPWLRPYAPHKLSPRSAACVFLGYSTQHHAYQCFHSATNKIYLSHHVIFHESLFPFNSTFNSDMDFSPSISAPPLPSSPSSNSGHFPLSSFSLSHHPLIQRYTTNNPQPHSVSPPTFTSLSTHPTAPTPTPRSPILGPNSTIASGHLSSHPSRPVTRSMHNIRNPNKKFLLTTKHHLPSPVEPTCVTQALKSPTWRAAMSQEFTALIQQGTWELVPKQAAQNLVGCKWVFRVKRKPDGSIDRFKAWLVAKAFIKDRG